MTFGVTRYPDAHHPVTLERTGFEQTAALIERSARPVTVAADHKGAVYPRFPGRARKVLIDPSPAGYPARRNVRNRAKAGSSQTRGQRHGSVVRLPRRHA